MRYPRRTKYGNRKVELDGIKFDSEREAKRYKELTLLERAGEIGGLQLQVPFEIIPGVVDERTGRVLQKPTHYIADFTYYEHGNYIVEDAKGYRTEVYRLKRKLMLWRHGIRIKET